MATFANGEALSSVRTKLNVVLDREVLLYDSGATPVTINALTGNIGGTNWGSLSPTYTHVRFEILQSAGAVLASVTIPTANWADNTQTQPFNNGTTWLIIQDMDIADNTFDVVEAGTTFNTGQLRIYGIKAN